MEFKVIRGRNDSVDSVESVECVTSCVSCEIWDVYGKKSDVTRILLTEVHGQNQDRYYQNLMKILAHGFNKQNISHINLYGASQFDGRVYECISLANKLNPRGIVDLRINIMHSTHESRHSNPYQLMSIL